MVLEYQVLLAYLLIGHCTEVLLRCLLWALVAFLVYLLLILEVIRGIVIYSLLLLLCCQGFGHCRTVDRGLL